MAEALRALDMLAAPPALPLDTAGVIVLHGDEPFLVREMLAVLRDTLCPDEADRSWAWREFSGDDDELDPRDVFDEAATVPMFATATRAAVVRSADAFVSAARERLESLATGPRGRRGILILEVKTFAATTRLAKAVAKDGLVIETSIPKGHNLAAWMRKWAQSRHGIQLAPPTAQRLLERLGSEIGQIDQALARLAAATPAADRTKPLGPEAVEDFVGSPQERTAWEMIDAATVGDAAAAIKQLAELLATGENPVGIAAQIAAVLRRLSSAARLLALPADRGRPASVEQALQQAGVAAWPKAVAQAKTGLTQLGPRRARQLPVWLFDLDLALKGDASRGLRARLALERLFCKMGRSVESGPRPSPRPASGARP